MSNITIQNFDDDLKNRLQKRAEYYGRSLEEEAKEILRAFGSPLSSVINISNQKSYLKGGHESSQNL
ncbi:FitA-like ribbon-helix-helix domain-containing protein [Floridanema evergladense]|uniref:Antitoxin FitA-like ribbon-helix-helix domain-containing protein n=1 Tax=Floridaenema evergladense BLCC-F167 TaxID=3153639 RepID=A0ABV4WER9_9CYAN